MTTTSTDTSTVTVAGYEVNTNHWIGGRRAGSVRTFEDLSPIDGKPLARIARAGQREADVAVTAAVDAFPAWSRTTRAERAAVLHRIADRLTERIEALAQVECHDQGGLLSQHRSPRGIARAISNFTFFADWLLEVEEDVYEGNGYRNAVSWNPAGPVLLINPWNGPLLLEAWKVAPALATGNTVVLKPSEWTPLTASLLAEASDEAGLPPGVLNVVQGYGEEVGAALVADPRIRRISFTGSVPTARLIATAAARNLTPCSFELGGKSPLIVMDDADLDEVVQVAKRQYSNAGQVCLIGSRLLVHERVAAEFERRFAEEVGTMVVGDPRDPGSDMGPLVHPDHFARVDGFVQRAKAAGARVVVGGAPAEGPGSLYYQPTLLADVAADSEIVTEEVFGPVLTLQTFATDADAVQMANSTRFGLTATLFTRDEERAARIAEQLVAGTVWVNCFWVRDLRAPFGGARESGIGREGGNWSFDFYSEVKNTVTPE